MPHLVAVMYPEMFKAEDVRMALWKLQRDYLLELDDAVVVTKDADSNVRLHQAVNLTALGAVSGGFWGTLVGMIFLRPILGATIGAASGAISGAITDAGIDGSYRRAKVLTHRVAGCATVFSFVCAWPL